LVDVKELVQYASKSGYHSTLCIVERYKLTIFQLPYRCRASLAHHKMHRSFSAIVEWAPRRRPCTFQTSCFHDQTQLHYRTLWIDVDLTSSEERKHKLSTQGTPSFVLTDKNRYCCATSDKTLNVEILVERHCETQWLACVCEHLMPALPDMI
jgi:hypothetical protein